MTDQVVYGFRTKFFHYYEAEITLKYTEGVVEFDIWPIGDNMQVMTVVFENDAYAMAFRFEHGDLVEDIVDSVKEEIVEREQECHLFATMCQFKNADEKDAFEYELTQENGVTWWDYDWSRKVYMMMFADLERAALFKLKHGNIMVTFSKN